MRTRTNVSRKAGFTLVELLVVIAIIALLVGILLPAVNRAQLNAQKVKDSTQIRNITQAFIQYSTLNNEQYPIPTRVDPLDQTEGPGGAGAPWNLKNRTGAIFAITISQDALTPDVMVAPNDTGNVQVYEEYQNTNPTTANEPALASYDPSFKGTTDDEAHDPSILEPTVSHNSYAHNCIAFGRGADWRNTVSASTPIVSNRGPLYDMQDADYDPERVWVVAQNNDLGDRSAAVALWGRGENWQGNVGFADTHVDFATAPTPDNATFNVIDSGERVAVQDNIFVDEVFESSGGLPASSRRNAYLRQWRQGIPIDISGSEFSFNEHLDVNNGEFAFTE